jgi:hypothetical protein
MTLRVVPIGLRAANEYIKSYHRHHGSVVGHKFSIAAMRYDKLVGVVIVGRPVNRVRDDGLTAEITRLCTDGSRNVCSLLYGAARKAAFAMGYERIGTYTLPEEGGASLRAAGFVCVRQTQGGSWSTPSRLREDKAPLDPKWLWESVRVRVNPKIDMFKDVL